MNREIAYIDKKHFKPEYQCLVFGEVENEIAVEGEWVAPDGFEVFNFPNEILIGDFSTKYTVPTLKGDMLTNEGYDEVARQISENTGCDVEWLA